MTEPIRPSVCRSARPNTKPIVRAVLIAKAQAQVAQTAIDARELGFKVTILADACATTDEELERLSLVYAERVVGAFVERVEDWQPGEAWAWVADT